MPEPTQTSTSHQHSIQSAPFLRLQENLLRMAVFNFLLVAIAGLFLRYYPFLSNVFLPYKNVLHAHSHFAFGGWIMPALTVLTLRYFPELCSPSNFKHWRNSIVIMVFSAYGMLLSFPFQGYGLISIMFSTLSLFSGFYLGYVIRNQMRPGNRKVSHSFLLAAFAYFLLSSLGPFATGPLIAMGYAGTNVYHNAIYFFLHFQYNGYFIFTILAVLYRIIDEQDRFNNGRLVFRLLNISCVPAYLLSVLWTGPAIGVNIIAGAAALIQLIAMIYFVNDIRYTKWNKGWETLLFRLGLAAILLKSLLQLISSIPAIAELAFQQRNFIIAYLHLVLIGCITFIALASMMKSQLMENNLQLRFGLRLFLPGFFLSELLLIAEAFNIQIRNYSELIFSVSILMPAGLLFLTLSIWRIRHRAEKPVVITSKF